MNIFNPDESKLNLFIDFKKFDSMGILKKMKFDKVNRPPSSVGRKKKAQPKKKEKMNFPQAKGLVRKKRY